MGVLIGVLALSAITGWITTVAFLALLGSFIDVSIISGGLGFAIAWIVFSVICFGILTVLPFPKDLSKTRRDIQHSLSHLDGPDPLGWDTDPGTMVAYIRIHEATDDATLLRFAVGMEFPITSATGGPTADHVGDFLAISPYSVPAYHARAIVTKLNDAMEAPFDRRRLPRARRLMTESLAKPRRRSGSS